MNNQKSMLDVAHEVMTASNHELTFQELYDAVVKALDMNEAERDERIGDFYTQLTLDGHFVALTDNKWDLRSRHTYDKVHIDVNDVYTDVDESDDDEEDKKEEKEYNAEIEGKLLEPDEEGMPSSEEGLEEKAPEETLSSLGVK